jgi:hypothetical protein
MPLKFIRSSLLILLLTLHSSIFAVDNKLVNEDLQIFVDDLQETVNDPLVTTPKKILGTQNFERREDLGRWTLKPKIKTTLSTSKDSSETKVTFEWKSD